MPDPKSLRVGDWIRILRVPPSDLLQRERERAINAPDAGSTADSIEQIIAQTPVVPIVQIDPDGGVWYEAKLLDANGRPEWHKLLVYDDETWERAEHAK